jgi:N-acyl-D-aspartate/D-glutamate deacylase
LFVSFATHRWVRPVLYPLLAAAVLATTGVASAGSTERYEILIVNGIVYDGTGAAPRHTDVGIKGGRIVTVDAPPDATARRRIDAAGRAVAPGFIDAHTHAPERVLQVAGRFIAPYLLAQGVTTMLIGADGGFSPAQLRGIMGVLATKGSALNFGCYVGHNGIRREVMGGAARGSSAAELDKMRELVREGMQFGCVGLSAGLMYEPGMFSGPDEIIALAKEVKSFGGTYDAHSRNPVIQFMSAETESIDIGAAAGIPAKLGHLKAVGLVNKGRSGEIIAAIDAARRLGREVVADMYPYDGAATGPLREILMLERGEPTAARPSLTQTQDRLRTIARDPAAIAALKAATENGIDGGFSMAKAVGYGSMRIVDAPGRAELVGSNIELLARERRIDPFALIIDLVLGGPDLTITVGAMDEADVQNLLRQPWMMVASDGFHVAAGADNPGAHPRSTGTFTRVLGHYVRDVRLFPLEEAIRRMTSLPAEHLGLRDRGRIAPGYAADVAIFDPKTVADRSTYANPNALSVGVSDVIVGGELVWENGAPTGATPGGFIPRQAYGPRLQ